MSGNQVAIYGLTKRLRFIKRLIETGTEWSAVSYCIPIHPGFTYKLYYMRDDYDKQRFRKYKRQKYKELMYGRGSPSIKPVRFVSLDVIDLQRITRYKHFTPHYIIGDDVRINYFWLASKIIQRAWLVHRYRAQFKRLRQRVRKETGDVPIYLSESSLSSFLFKSAK